MNLTLFAFSKKKKKNLTLFIVKFKNTIRSYSNLRATMFSCGLWHIYIYIYIDTHIHTTILASIGQDSERWEITYSILWALTCFNVKERWNKGNTGISMWVSTCSKQFVMTFICKNPYEIIVIHRKSLWIW